MTEPRKYNTPARQLRAAQTRERILAAGSQIVHGFASWDWKGLTFRAVAERAGVGERTVYRHFPTERHLHDAVMQQIEEEAGVVYEDMDLATLGEIANRVFASRSSFAAGASIIKPEDPTFVAADVRRRTALLHAVCTATPQWSAGEQQTLAGLLDVLWLLPSYERLVSGWDLPGDNAAEALNWAMSVLLQAIDRDTPPPGVTL